MKTYVFKVELEPDGDGWRAFCPAWEHIGASTWGCTRKEAMQNIREVLELVLADLIEENDPIPELPEGSGFVSTGIQVAVTV